MIGQFDFGWFQKTWLFNRTKWRQIYTKDWFFPLLYTSIYFSHCLFSWDRMKSINSELKTRMILEKGHVSFWQLYPFQILSVYFVFIFYLFFAYFFLYILKKLGVLNVSIPFISFSKDIIRLFFAMICILYLGNCGLGILHASDWYSMYIFLFWISLYLLFIKENGRIYKQIFSTPFPSMKPYTKGIGYIIPIVWSGLIIILLSI
ncbi:hypothetical protein AB3N60_04800 [Leptospira sp. WS39.C2]